jgi:RIO-like serine/threonine protein kinase
MNNIFKSRRNRVWLEDGRVHKLILSGAEAARAEADILRRLSDAGVAVPRLFDINGDVLILEYIKGATLTEEIEREMLAGEILAELIARWFADFYAVFPGRIRGDVNCRNFIITPDARVYGVDFEDLQYGRKEADLGRMTAFILTYDPAYTDYKKKLAQSLTDCFGLNFGVDCGLAAQEQSRELAQMRRRR